MKLANLILPEFSLLDSESHEGNPLEGRWVIYHSRTASVVEVLQRSDVVLIDDSRPQFKFSSNRTGEKWLAVLHYSATLDEEDEYDEIRAVMRSCAKWYIDLMAWEDAKILSPEELDALDKRRRGDHGQET